SAEGRLSAVLGLRLPGLGGQVPRRMVPAGHALADRTDEESRSHVTRTSRTAAELLSRPQGAFERRHRGLEQQGQSDDEKILRISDLQRHRTRAVSRTWKASGAATRPQIFLTIRKKSGGLSPAAELRPRSVFVRARSG